MEKGKKLLVTGSSGFVGGFIVEAALAEGYEVHAGIRATSNTQYLTDPRIRLTVMDFRDEQGLTDLLQREHYDCIIHNVGLVAATTQEKLNAVNVGTLKTLVDCLRKANVPPQRLVYTSSLAAYGPADDLDHGYVQDSDNPRPVTMYGRSKLASEQYLQQQKDIDYVVLRPTGVYGPHDQEFLPVYKSVQKGIKASVGMHNQKLTLVYVEDLAQAFMLALTTKHRQKAYFITDGARHTTPSFNDEIAKVMGIRGLAIRVPIPIIKVAAHVSGWLGKWRGQYPVLNPDKVNELKAKSWLCDHETAKQELGYTPHYSLKHGLEKTLQWCKETGLL